MQQIIVNTCQKKRIETDDSGETVVASIITEISYLVVNLFCDVVLPLWLFIFVILSSFGCAVLFFRHSDKSGYGFLKINHPISVRAYQAELFSNEIFSLYCKARERKILQVRKLEKARQEANTLSNSLEIFSLNSVLQIVVLLLFTIFILHL